MASSTGKSAKKKTAGSRNASSRSGSRSSSGSGSRTGRKTESSRRKSRVSAGTGASGRSGISAQSRGRRNSSAKGNSSGRMDEEERRATEIRRDIRLVILLGVMIFLTIANFGYGGIVGSALSVLLFGLFGTTAYVVPLFLFFVTVFVISNRGKKTLPAKTAALIVLLLIFGVIFELHSGSLTADSSYSAAKLYQRCAAGRDGGGLIGGGLAFVLYKLFRKVGTVCILIVAAAICLLILTQRSLVGAYRRSQEERIRRGDPSFMEKQRLRAQEARAESAQRREVRAQERRREREEIQQLRDKEDRDREERRRLLQAKHRKTDPADLGKTELSAGFDEPEGEDYGLDENNPVGLFRRKGTEEKNQESVTAAAARAEDSAAGKDDGDSQHGIRSREKEQDSGHSGHTKDIHISVLPVGRRGRKDKEEQDQDEEAVEERVLRPDANTVRVEAGDMSYGSGRKPGEVPVDPSHATLTVFTRTNETGPGEKDLQFPFNEGAADRRMHRVYAREGGLDSAMGGAGDIADAGGMSTYSAQHENSDDYPDEMPEGQPAGEEEVPWGADELTEEEMEAIEAQEAAYEQGRSVPSEKEDTLKSVSDNSGEHSVRPDAAGDTRAESDISEEKLSGIEVHRDRGESRGTGASTVVSGQKRTQENRQYNFPLYSLMTKGQKTNSTESDRELKETAFRLQDTLRTFGVNVTITDISQGPAVTRYELQPEKGVKVSKIVSLADDIKLSLAAMDIRIEAPIPGKSAIGIEVPNRTPSVVALRDILESQEFRTAKSKLAFAVGKDIGGKTIVTDIAKMPHLLIAGATGSGKSVCINTIIMSVLYKASPDEVKLIMIDPKVVELSVYNGIPHLMIPVVTDARKASAALNWAVAEMERRYKLFAAAGVRDLNGYNNMVRAKGDEAGENEKVLPRMIVIVDELADLMMVAKNEVESSICRLAQLARAAGIHLIIATQRPSVDVITGLIKANMPSRIAFAVTSQVDSRTILDMAGAEKLIGKGDMLFYPQSYQKPARIQGAFISDDDVQKVVDFIRERNPGWGTDEEANRQIENGTAGSGSGGAGSADSHYDKLFVEAGRFIIENKNKNNRVSIGMLQRVFKIGFNRAARIMDQLAEAGVVSDENSTRARPVLMSMEEFEEYVSNEMG